VKFGASPVFDTPGLHVSGMAGATAVPNGPRLGVRATTGVAWGACAVATAVGSDVPIGAGGGAGAGVAEARVMGSGPP
jgi:hypothetical protein